MGRPTILVDMDGPLADFDGRYWTEATGKWNLVRRETRYPWDIDNPGRQVHRFLSDHLVDRGFAAEFREFVNSPGWFAGLSMVLGAHSGLLELAEHADVWICSKPLASSPTCRDEKAQWLETHVGEGWGDRLILAADKSMIRGEVLLDDAIKPGWVPSAVWAPVVFDTSWNRSGRWAGNGEWARFSWSDGVEALLTIARSR